ncbi:hypothetical protein Tco_1265402 [Tanacetum coccineum]
MAASTIPVSAEENLGDPIDIRVDIIHPEPVAAVAFPAAAIVRTQAQHGEAIRGIQEHLLGVPIQEELTALRFRADIAEAENASLRARIKTTEAIKKITRSGYKQKDRKPSQNDKTEHGMEKTVQNQGQSPKMPKSESILKNQQSKPRGRKIEGLHIECNLYPSDGPGIIKTVKTKWALNQFQQPICVQLTKTVKTLKAQS